MYGNPRCPICGLYELNDGSEDALYTCECDDEDLPLSAFLSVEDHACSTGDCGHEKQSECDTQLAKDYKSKPTGDGGE